MRFFPIAAVVFLLGLLPTSFALAQDQLCGDKTEIQQILSECREALAELKGMNKTNPNYQIRKSTALQIRRIRRQLKHLRSELAMQADEQAEGPAAMNAASFASLLKAVKAESFGKGKTRVIESAAANNHFSVAQLRKLMKQYSFAAEKIDLAAKLHPRLVDPGNFFQVYQDLTFEADKKRLKKRVSK